MDVSTPPARIGDLHDLCAFLDDSPSPWHVVDTARRRLTAEGFTDADADPSAAWMGDGFVVRDGSIVAWRRGTSAAAGFHIVGAHTDSPGLRIKPNPDLDVLGWQQLAVEVYGGTLLNSWLDRDLGIAGRVVTTDGPRLVAVREPVCRIPQLAIHLDREVNERGLVLDKQAHLSPVWGTGDVMPLRAWLAGRLGTEHDRIVTWDLGLFDITTASILGGDGSLLSSGRLDNQLSCWAAVSALVQVAPTATHSVIALFDHEEVGSESSTGAAGPLLEHVLERLVLAGGGGRADYLDALAGSRCVSADNAHAVHPNYMERHDPGHRPLVNHGPAIKLNSNQRYATSAASAAWMIAAFDAAGVPWQRFVSRNTMPCGSTIGPITATRLGIDTVDVGVPQLSMHSARELCGAADPAYLRRGLVSFLNGD